jgi:hypothetical protein
MIIGGSSTKFCLFNADRISKMAVTAGHRLTLDPILTKNCLPDFYKNLPINCHSFPFPPTHHSHRTDKLNILVRIKFFNLFSYSSYDLTILRKWVKLLIFLLMILPSWENELNYTYFVLRIRPSWENK